MLDASNSITQSSFTKMKNYVTAALRSFEISPKKTRVSIVTFAKDTNAIVDLNTGVYREVLARKLSDATKENGQRNLGKALEFVDQKLFNSATGGRKDADKVVVIITGNEVNPYKDTNFVTGAKKLKDQNTKIVVVGVNIDNNVQTEFANPDNLITTLTDFEKLPRKFGEVEKHIRGKGSIVKIIDYYVSNVLK